MREVIHHLPVLSFEEVSLLTIYTTYYGNVKNVSIDKCISISRSTPIPMIRMAELSPSSYTFSLKNDRDEFISSYMNQLSKLDPTHIINKIYSLVGDNAILVCYEHPRDFCHRKLVGQWIYDNLGIQVKEVDVCA